MQRLGQRKQKLLRHHAQQPEPAGFLKDVIEIPIKIFCNRCFHGSSLSIARTVPDRTPTLASLDGPFAFFQGEFHVHYVSRRRKKNDVLAHLERVPEYPNVEILILQTLADASR